MDGEIRSPVSAAGQAALAGSPPSIYTNRRTTTTNRSPLIKAFPKQANKKLARNGENIHKIRLEKEEKRKEVGRSVQRPPKFVQDPKIKIDNQ